MHTPYSLLMIRPIAFNYNQQTAEDNAFQTAPDASTPQSEISTLAQQEFDEFVTRLRAHHVNVIEVQDTLEPHTPDSIFPNNWISVIPEGKLCLYPMYAQNRRDERKPNVIETIKNHFDITDNLDFSCYEKDNVFLEGTGSMILDHENKIAYACHSIRTDQQLLDQWCNHYGYKAVGFDATDMNDKDIYHTNVMMCLADTYAVICLESIKDIKQKELVIDKLIQTGKEIIEISLEQMNKFAGNMLQVRDKLNKTHLVMSEQAYNSLNNHQKQRLNALDHIIHVPLYTIETNGGGSARCMMAEIHAKPKEA